MLSIVGTARFSLINAGLELPEDIIWLMRRSSSNSLSSTDCSTVLTSAAVIFGHILAKALL